MELSSHNSILMVGDPSCHVLSSHLGSDAAMWSPGLLEDVLEAGGLPQPFHAFPFTGVYVSLLPFLTFILHFHLFNQSFFGVGQTWVDVQGFYLPCNLGQLTYLIALQCLYQKTGIPPRAAKRINWDSPCEVLARACWKPVLPSSGLP